MAELRVVSWNVRSLRDDGAAVAEVLRGCRPDVVAVQEAPRFARWRSKRAALARTSGLLVATADRTGGLFVMVSMRTRVVSTTYRRLPDTPRHHKRAVAAATVELAGARWSVASTHLDGDPAEREQHLEPLWDAVCGLERPLVLAGDLNEEPGGPVFGELASRLQDAWAVAPVGDGVTSPARAPRRRIDVVLADRSVEVVSCEVLDGPLVAAASDHRPVLAVLRQPAATRR